MSAYHVPAATPSYPASGSTDPTAVIGRRIGGWVIDFLLYMLIMAFVSPTPLSPLAEYYDTSDTVDACSVLQEDYDAVGCVEIGDRAYVTEGGDVAIQLIVWVAVVLLYSLLQGARGITPGKAVFGIKVVDEQGGQPGFGKSLLRTILWAVDLAPWCIPGLVGFITGLTTKGHRRVGDMAAKTFVVGKSHEGPVHVPGLATAATGGYPAGPGGYAPPGQQWGAPPPGTPGAGGWGSPPQAQQQGAWGAPPSGGFPVAGAPGAGGPAPAGAPGSSGTPSGEQRPAPPGARPTGPSPEPGVPSPTAGTPSPPGAAPSPGSDVPSPTAGAPSPAGGADAPGSPGSSGQAPDTGPSDPDQSPGDAGDVPRPSGPAGTPGGDAPGATSSGTGATGSGPPSTSAAPSPGAPAAGTPGAPAPTGPAPGPAAAPAAQAAPTGYNPQWDAARGTYIVWEPNRGKWLGWDEAAKEWKPL